MLPHVFHQIRLLEWRERGEDTSGKAALALPKKPSRSRARYRGIRSVAEATGEELGVLDGVCGQVHLQAGSVDVTTVTVLALERFVFVVLPTVRLWKERKSPSLHGATQATVRHDLQPRLPAGWTTE